MPSCEKNMFNVLKVVSKVAEKLANSKFKIRRTKEFSENVEKLTDYFGTNENEAWLLCAFISDYFNNNGENTNFNDLACFFGCSVMAVLAFKSEIENLLEKRYIKNTEGGSEKKVSLKNEFELNPEFLECILQNEKIALPEEEEKKLTAIDFVRECGLVVDNRYRNQEFSRYGLVRRIQSLEKKYKEVDFAKNIIEIVPDVRLRAFFYDSCSDFLSGNSTGLDITILDIYDDIEHFEKANEFMNENNLLFTRGLIEFDKKEILTEATVTITHKAKEMLFGNDLWLFIKTTKGTDIITPEKITEKPLFYSEENQREINRLHSSLEEENFKRIQNRLIEKGMPKGIAVLLYGKSGTGKTETVYQIAKATGRKIFHVDISSSKSCWFGESEKIIKKIFTDYKDLCKMCIAEKDGKMPILLFNEADGILSKRKDSVSGNVAQTENSMQNIILEEMEKLEGIMIATTNLAENLDAAFERRFLFKVEFENPNFDAKKKIWRSKLEWLDESDLEKFASRYDLSGGQIDNIVRKITMDEILNGEKPKFDAIDEMCRHERLVGDKKIGF